MLFLEYLSGIGIIYFFALLIEQLLYKKDISNIIYISEENKIYIYEDNIAKGILINSYTYKSLEAIKLKTLSKKPNSVKNLIDIAYDESFAHISMGCVSINQIKEKWDTYVTSLNLGNLFVDIMLLVSAFLKKEFGINAIILNNICYISIWNFYYWNYII